jgi:gliding motility-associated lipoprotein GldH
MILFMKPFSAWPARLAVFLVLSSALVSCDKTRLFEDNREFTNRAWMVTEEPRFEFTVKDTSRRYNLYYNVRNSLSYPYSRIFVTVHLYDSTGKELFKKLVNNDLFDEKTGRPLGDSGLGDLFDHQFVLIKNHQFGFSGKYSIKLDQLMRQDTLKGVIAVGIRVEEAQDQQ